MANSLVSTLLRMSKNKRQFLSVVICRLHLVDLLIFIQKMYFSALNGSCSRRNHTDSLVTNKESKKGRFVTYWILLPNVPARHCLCHILDTFATYASPALLMMSLTQTAGQQKWQHSRSCFNNFQISRKKN